MNWLQHVLDFLIHLDRHLASLVQEHGVWTYAVLFAIIFCETGLIVTPFLPGDSLLFTAGSLAALGGLHVHGLVALLIVAAIAGDSLNYSIGHWIGPRAFRAESRLLNRSHLERTQAFYARHGGKTVVLARFLPIARTFAPFVAGIGRMPYGHFLLYNVVGACVWVALFTYAGFFFGNLPIVKDHFTLIMLGIVVVSLLPAIVEGVRAMVMRRRLSSI